MKAVILAGGYGTRLMEETGVLPKPMVEIGGKPILWHIMKTYSHWGINDFIICCGYKGYVIKQYFANYRLHTADVTFDFQNNTTTYHRDSTEDWRITLVETGEGTMTGGRLKKIAPFVKDETFFFTYGDGLTDLDIPKALAFHKKQKVLATMTAVQPPGRFGAFSLSRDQTKVLRFKEKPRGDGAWVNGGYFILEPKALGYIKDSQTVWEQEPLQTLAHEGKLAAYKHQGYWQNMDTLRDKTLLDALWKSGKAPWKGWER